jgi:hypothetical protein
LIRALSINFGSSSNIQLLTHPSNDPLERKIHCRSSFIENTLSHSMQGILNYEIDKETTDGQIERVKQEFRPEWIVDLTAY